MATIIEKDSGDGGGGGGNVLLSFILGAVLLAVAIVGFFMWDNYKSGGAPKSVTVTTQSKEEPNMGDKDIITEEQPAKPDVVVVEQKPEEKTEKVVTEKTTVTETKL